MAANDPFEEFEFKPLTEGLGFHKKNKSEAKNMSPATATFRSQPLGLGIDVLDEEASPMTTPLPRQAKMHVPEETFDSSSAAVEEILQTLRAKKSVETPSAPLQKKAAPAPLKFKTSVQKISAFFLDGMLVMAGTLLCMIVLLSVTKVDVAATLFNPQADSWIFISTAALVGMVTFVYLVFNRIFLGATPGEWAYDQRLGYPNEIGTASYAGAVIVRALLVVITGIFTLPLLSMIIKRDLAGDLTATQLLERT